ncbi:MAG: YbhB/YbcL family Raf kinase inhibitor-like protein [Ilyomonas sp.]
MEIKSSLFNHGEAIPKKNTCLGPNINPSLHFENVPAETKSLVLIFEDVDATPKPWTHWMLFNIPPSTKEVSEGKIPEGAIEGLANNHSFGYEGPCPKYFKGTHHYWFRFYALNTNLDLPAATEREEVEAAMQSHIIAKAELLGLCTAPENIEEEIS